MAVIDGDDTNNILNGGDADDTINGFGGNDSLDGGGGIDTLNGGDGADSLLLRAGDSGFGGAGDDLVSLGQNGVRLADGGDGYDVLRLSDTGTAGVTIRNFEALATQGGVLTALELGSFKLVSATSAGAPYASATLREGGLAMVKLDAALAAFTLTGSSAADRITFNADFAGRIIFQGADAAGDGNDIVTAGAGADQLHGGGGDDILRGLAGDDYLSAGDGFDRLSGGDGDDILVLGAKDRGDGGFGDDVFVLEGDRMTAAGGDGTDTAVLQGDADISAAAISGVEVLQSFGGRMTAAQLGGFVMVADYASSGEFSVVLTQGGAATVGTFDSGLGRFVLHGSAGADAIAFSPDAAAAIEFADDGGGGGGGGGGGDDAILAGAGADTLDGGAGDDVLDGRGGADLMIGGAGNDVFFVDQSGDVVSENAGEGLDVVMASRSWTLAANIENLTLLGGARNGTGNAGANVLTGTVVDNVLSGLGGDDLLAGGEGADTLAGGGGADTLDGGSGADAMTGGLGDDVYVVDDAGDTTIEASGGGVDLVRATLSWTLAANVENLSLGGSAALDGTGNGLANVLTGNDGANVLTGAGGADTLRGAGGSDVLRGGAGADVFAFGKADDSLVATRDVIRALSGSAAFEGAGVAGGDRIDLSGIDANDLVAGDQAFVFSASRAAGTLACVDVGGVTRVLGFIDGVAGADFRIDIEDGAVIAAQYAAGDFVL